MTTTYPTLITFVRNICEHFPEHKKIFKDDADVLRVLGDNKTSFIEYVLNKYPYLIADIFKSFRKALLSGKCLNDDYDVYFENLCSQKILCRPGDSITGVAQSLDDGMQNLGLKNNLPWRDLVNKDTITKDDILNLDCKDLRPYIVVELVLKFVSQTDATGADIDDLSKKFLVDNIALMDADYYYCVSHEVKNLQMLGVKRNSKHGCKYKVGKNGLYQRPVSHENIKTTQNINASNCLNYQIHVDEQKILTFNLQSVKEACTDDYHWWLEFAENKRKRMHSFLTGRDDELVRILNNCTKIMLHRSSEKFKEKPSVFRVYAVKTKEVSRKTDV